MRRIVLLVIAAAVAATALGATALAQSDGVQGGDEARPYCVLDTVPAGSTGPEPPPVCFETYRESIKYATNGHITDAPNDAGRAARDEAFEERLGKPFPKLKGTEAAAFEAWAEKASGGASTWSATETSAADATAADVTAAETTAPDEDLSGSPETDTGTDPGPDPNPPIASRSTTYILGTEYAEANYGNTLAPWTVKGSFPCDSDGYAEHQRRDLRSVSGTWNWNDRISSFNMVDANRCQAQHYQHIYFGGDRMVPRDHLPTMGVWDNEASSIRYR